MSETKEIQRFHDSYDNYAVAFRDAAKQGNNTDVLYYTKMMELLDKTYVDIDKAIDEHVEDVECENECRGL